MLFTNSNLCRYAAASLYRLVNPPPTTDRPPPAGAGAAAGAGAGAEAGAGVGAGVGAGGREEEDDGEQHKSTTTKPVDENENENEKKTKKGGGGGGGGGFGFGGVAGLTRLEATVAGVLALTPVMLLLPTSLAFYLSYLALHALTVAARAAMAGPLYKLTNSVDP